MRAESRLLFHKRDKEGGTQGLVPLERAGAQCEQDRRACRLQGKPVQRKPWKVRGGSPGDNRDGRRWSWEEALSQPQGWGRRAWVLRTGK